MKKIILTVFTIILSAQLFAQKIEISAQAYSGLFHYSGNGAGSTSSINSEGGIPPQAYTNDPYGTKNGFSYGGGVQAQYVSKDGFIAGFQGGYDVLKSIVNIDSENPLVEDFLNNQSQPAKGQTTLQNHSININPYAGYRFNVKKIKIDIMPGIDLALNVSSYNKGSATTTDGTYYNVDYKMPKAPTDVRLRLEIAAYYKRFGLTAGYAHGITNYASNLNENTGGGSSATQAVHSELLRFGIAYRIK